VTLVLADTLTFGAYIGYFFFAVAAVCTLLAVLAGFLLDEGRLAAVGTFAGAGLVVFVITLVSMWPLEYPYHHWVDVRGQVTDINRRIVSTGDNSISQRYVVLVRGQQYGVDDTRAALLKRGDPVSLRCKKEHQFMQPHDADGWACRWGSRS
jgi:hypothetical protein